MSVDNAVSTQPNFALRDEIHEYWSRRSETFELAFGHHPEKKIEFLKTDHMASQIPSVKAGHYLVMRTEIMNPNLRTIDGMPRKWMSSA